MDEKLSGERKTKCFTHVFAMFALFLWYRPKEIEVDGVNINDEGKKYIVLLHEKDKEHYIVVWRGFEFV